MPEKPKLVALGDVHSEPVAAVVEECERLLKLAKQGHLRTIAVAGVLSKERGNVRFWAHATSPGGDRLQLMGSVVMLQHQLMECIDMDTEDSVDQPDGEDSS